ncbi:PREDICTED: uncharacterized protein LOC109339038 [Lupinus angustifolius]|uniref:uncharacterized protein LOC109339038 n=1 Tax=Lupinus angustifolius TaxID=3871 RepID=UPI00092FD94C|nr:PREDICTED: uncharacterized protein LOC109339038 [Lupinus angustifolius]
MVSNKPAENGIPPFLLNSFPWLPPLTSRPSSSHQGHDTSFTAIVVYVDDLVLTGNKLHEIKIFKHILQQSFQIKDLGSLRYFLGLEIARTKQGLHLNQRKYTLSLLEDSCCLASKPAKNPFDPSIKLQLDKGEPISNPSSYRRLAGRLIYLTISKPDISYVVKQLSLFMHKPMDTHYNATTRVLHHLKTSPAQGLFFSSSNKLKLTRFSNSGWACCLDTRKSLIGLCIFLGNSLISWKTRNKNYQPFII